MEPRDFRRIEELYHAALERQPGERDAFLQEACGGDEDLFREVRSLLDHEEGAKRLLEEPVVDAATQKVAVLRGTRLGPYEIVEQIGAGGMGEVYRAHDTRLGRDVAMKLLPASLVQDPEALARLQREARAVATLSHPHICALHDIGRHDGIDYLVMELVEGETLARRLERGGLPLDQVLRYAAEIAEALGAAHARGIVHRDLKPGNVMLTRAGAKLLDFGLAKLRPADGVAGGERALTHEGVVAGTLPYMSPEHLVGGRVDARTDIFALGAVIYEMVTGERAFPEDSQASLIASIVKGETRSLASRRPGTPAALDRLVRQCLSKDPADRWQAAQDVALRLREIAETDPQTEARLRVRETWRLVVPGVGGAVALALVLGVVVGRLWSRPRERVRALPVVRSHIDMPPGTALTDPIRTQLALSPDGMHLVWSGRPEDRSGEPALYLRRLDGDEARRLPGTEGAEQPFFSPDGRWVAFFSHGKLRRVSVDGGLAIDLAEVPGLPMGASWASDGRICLGAGDAGLRWVPAEGGSLRELTAFDRAREVGHRLPRALPDGRTVLMTTMPIAFGVGARVEAVSLGTGERKVLIEDGADARYLPTGHLVFVRQGVLMAAPFDAGRLELEGTPVPVVEGLSQALNMGTDTANSGAGQAAISDSGLLVYGPGGIGENPPTEVILMDESCRAELLPGFDRPQVFQGRFSPDGRLFAFVEWSAGLWLFDVERRTHRALRQEGHAGGPLWSPDGRRLALHWTKAGPPNLWSVPVDGQGEWEQLTVSEVPDLASSWSPDGRVLAFIRQHQLSTDVLLYRFEDGQIVPFLTTEANEGYAEFSPDGRWMAYVSDESGRPEVYVTSFPDGRQVLAVSDQGGRAPAWSRDGQRLFYRSLDRRSLMSVSVRRGRSLSLGRPRRLCETPPLGADPWRGYDLHPDGRRFQFQRLKTGFAPPPPITRLNVIHNWFAELQRSSPTGRQTN